MSASTHSEFRNKDNPLCRCRDMYKTHPAGSATYWLGELIGMILTLCVINCLHRHPAKIVLFFFFLKESLGERGTIYHVTNSSPNLGPVLHVLWTVWDPLLAGWVCVKRLTCNLPRYIQGVGCTSTSSGTTAQTGKYRPTTHFVTFPRYTDWVRELATIDINWNLWIRIILLKTTIVCGYPITVLGGIITFTCPSGRPDFVRNAYTMQYEMQTVFLVDTTVNP